MKREYRLLSYFSNIFLLLSLNLSAQTGESWQAPRETVEKLSKQDSQSNYYEEKVPAYTLPDVLANSSGQKINKSDEWTSVRRQEVLELFRENVYGRVPSTPFTKTYTLVNEDQNAMGGSATLKQVDITIQSEGKSLIIHLNIFIPNKAKKPVPAFLLINLGSRTIDPTRKEKNEWWPAEEIVVRGYAAAAFSNSDVDADNFDDFKNGVHGLLDRGIRPPDAWGTIAAWAWGASRCMDYLETDKDIDTKKVALVGHSRGGKTALWAGAQDQRFSMVISNESGCGGAALARRRYGETVARINTSFPHWFCSNYKKYSDNENAMPVDMHMLLALIAPRALYVACADEDLWGDPKGSYLSLYNALPVFQLIKVSTGISETMPPLNKQVISGKIAYHIRDGAHNLLLKDWKWFMDFADVQWK